MAKPSFVFIGGVRHRVHWYSETEWINGPLSNDLCGQYEAAQACIHLRLTPNAVRDHFREILTHEMLHGIWYHQNIRDVKLEDGGEDAEERVVAGMAFGLAQVLSDPRNKEVVRWLTKT